MPPIAASHAALAVVSGVHPSCAICQSQPGARPSLRMCYRAIFSSSGGKTAKSPGQPNQPTKDDQMPVSGGSHAVARVCQVFAADNPAKSSYLDVPIPEMISKWAHKILHALGKIVQPSSHIGAASASDHFPSPFLLTLRGRLALYVARACCCLCNRRTLASQTYPNLKS